MAAESFKEIAKIVEAPKQAEAVQKDAQDGESATDENALPF
jgi:hypothetical protein